MRSRPRARTLPQPVTPARVAVFAALGKCPRVPTDVLVRTSWGTSRVHGPCRLTQVHRDILDAILAHAVETYDHSDGPRSVLVDQTTLLKAIGQRPTHHTWLHDKLDDLLNTRVDIDTPRKTAHGHILASWCAARDTAATHALVPQRRGRFPRRPLVVTLSAQWMRLTRDDAVCHITRRRVAVLVELPPFVRAAARLLLTQRPGTRINFNHALSALGVGRQCARMRRRRRREIRDAAPQLRALGIRVDPERWNLIRTEYDAVGTAVRTEYDAMPDRI